MRALFLIFACCILVGCDDHIFPPPPDCEEMWDDCEGGFACRICFAEDIRWMECSDGWSDVIPDPDTSEAYEDDVCHCFPSVEGC